MKQRYIGIEIFLMLQKSASKLPREIITYLTFRDVNPVLFAKNEADIGIIADQHNTATSYKENFFLNWSNFI